MITECNVKTVTEIEGNGILITSSSTTQDGTVERPTIFRTDLLEEEKTINKALGVEGELLLTHVDSNKTVGELDDEGNLILSLNDDDVDKYYVGNDGQLKYEQ